MILVRREMRCEELVELVTAYFEGSLGGVERRSFEAHIRACEHCSAYLEQMRLTIEAAGRIDEDDLEPAAREALLRAFRDWKREQTA